MYVVFFRGLEQHLGYLHTTQIKAIKRAYIFARQAHQHQKRYTGDLYITHPVAVACILAKLHFDTETLITALLHDVIEDTEITKQDISENFSEKISILVDGVSKLTQIEFKNNTEAKAKNLQKMLLATVRDIRVIIIKLADRLHNMHTIKACILSRRRRVALETLEIFAPIAKRLGMHKIATELEELGFETLYPKRHEVLNQVINQLHRKRKVSLKQLKNKLSNHLKNGQLPPFEILGREKNLYSIYKKMRDKKISFHAVYDVYAFRIVLNDESLNSCYLVLGLVHQLYKPITNHFKDYIATPKNNGYQSLHTILFGPSAIPIEIQIRNHAMDYRANNGIAAHWLYKSNEPSISQSELISQQWIQNLLEIHQNATNPEEFIKNFKIKLFPNEIYVFTPKGKILALPKGSTIVDFAYAIHTDIGHTCFAAKVDRRFVPLYTRLKNSQVIEIITSSKVSPNPAWLDFVTTNKAINAIQQTLKKQRYKESIYLGKYMLKQALAEVGIPSISKIKGKNITALLNETGMDNFDELYEQIALGNQVSHLIAHKLVRKYDHSKLTPKKHTQSLTIRGTENLIIRFANCCQPIPGDPIVGGVKMNHGLIIHHAQCKTIKYTPNCSISHQHIPVRWGKNIQKEFTVRLEVLLERKQESLTNLTRSIAQAQSTIYDIVSIKRGAKTYLIHVEILVTNKEHLEKIIYNIEQLKSIISAQRLINQH